MIEAAGDQRSRLRQLAEMLQEEGYLAKISDEGYIVSGIGGLKISIGCDEDGPALYFQCGISLTEESGFGVEQANAYNAAYRFGKVYLDEEGDVALEADYLFSFDHDDAAENLRTCMGLFEGSLRLLRNDLAAAQKGAAGGDVAAPASGPFAQS